jgi:predicted Rossmann fold nucleotide-binding protein DprA/Smf involved in DNA uptake
MKIFGLSRKPSVSHVYIITPLGRTKFDRPGLPELKYLVLSKLKESPCSVHEIAEDTNISEKKVGAILSDLRHDGYVKSAEGMEE